MEHVYTDKQMELIALAESHNFDTPEFKIKKFVQNSHLHPLHKIKQLMLELVTRKDAYAAYDIDILRFEAQIEVEKARRDLCELEAEKRLHDVEIIDIERKLSATRRKADNAYKEIQKYLRLIEEFNASIEARDDTGKLYLDILEDHDACEAIEAEYWQYRLAKQAALDLVAYGRIGGGNLDAILQLDADAQNKTIAMAYEVLMMNEHRTNRIQEMVYERLNSGKTVSDISSLMNLQMSDFMEQLEFKENVDVPLIQKR